MLRKFFFSLASVVVVFFIVLFLAMSIFDSPTYAWRILRYGESDINDMRIFPERIIEKGETYSLIECCHRPPR